MTKKVSKIEKKFSKKSRIGRSGIKELQRQIAAACDGLIYISETDAPVQPLVASDLDADILTVLMEDAGKPPDTNPEKISLDRFFERLIRIEAWFGSRDIARAERFRSLLELLRNELSDLRAYRVGEVNVRYFVVGRDAAGRLVGIKTAAVET